MSSAARWGWIAVPLVVALGCRSTERALVPYDATAGLFEQATIRYELDAGQQGVPVAATRIEGQRVSYVPIPSSPLPERSIGRLEVTYPHPRLGRQAAQVTLLLKSEYRPTAADGSTGPPEPVEETWQIDISSTELATLVGALRASGYFDPGAETSSEARIESQIDGRTVRRSWKRLPAFDWLIQRTRSQGQLIAYRGSAALPGPSEDRFSTVAAIAALEQQGQYERATPDWLGPGRPVAVTANPFLPAPPATIVADGSLAPPQQTARTATFTR